MKREEFAKYLREWMLVSITKSELERLEKPSAKNPDLRDIEKSEMFRNLSDSEKSVLEKIVFDTAKSTIFSFLVMIDGCGWFLDNKGEFELNFVKNNEKTKLNSPNQEDLHDLFMENTHSLTI